MSDLSIARYFPFAGVRVVDQALETLEDGSARAVIALEPEADAWPVCSGCNRVCWPVHSYSTRRVRDLNLAHARVDTHVTSHRLRRW